jgi:hypothetical protein
VRNFLPGLQEALAAELLLVARETMEAARDMAPEGAPPRDEPRLKDSFSVEAEGITTRVTVTNPHAAYVEFGTGRRGADSPSQPKAPAAGYDPDWPGMAAQPYLYPAAQMARTEFPRRMAKAARRGFH